VLRLSLEDAGIIPRFGGFVAAGIIAAPGPDISGIGK
jgi:hypothetical protein